CLCAQSIQPSLSNLQNLRRLPLACSYYFSAPVSTFCSTPRPGCFSLFPLGTGSLSVTREYLALVDGPPGFRRNVTCSAVLRIHFGGNAFSTTGLLPPMAYLFISILLKYFLVTPNEVSYNSSR